MCTPLVFFYPLLHRTSHLANADFTTFTRIPVAYAVTNATITHIYSGKVSIHW